MAKISKLSKIFVAGHRGLVGSAVHRNLESKGFSQLLTRTRDELNLRDKQAVIKFFQTENPEYVILAAAKVGGIGANSAYPVEFLLENLEIQNNVISAAADFDVKKLVFLGSSCIYPREAKYPLTEDQLLSGPFEQTNEAYALAKVAGIRLCQYYAREYSKNFISLMPTNMYGPRDYYDFENSHVIPAMLLKVLRAKSAGDASVEFWGSGEVYREFLHSDDLAEAIYTCLESYDDSQMMNVGSEREVSIRQLAETVCEVCGYEGEIQWDRSKPDGTRRKVMDSSRIRSLGWTPQYGLRDGLKSVVQEASDRLQELESGVKRRAF